MIGLLSAALIFFSLRLMVVVFNFFTWPVLRKNSRVIGEEKVSILVPARNEAATISSLILSVLAQPYQDFELLVLDDESEDGTADLVSRFAAADGRIRLIAGQPLPPGWLGKNWACHQLAEKATGNYLLFLDADVKISGNLIESLMKELREKKLSLLSVFPLQQMVSAGEKATVPLMNLLLLSLLPLRLVLWSRQKSLAAANGQCMFFSADEYRQQQWHSQVKNEVAEDIALMRLIKAHHLRGEVLLATHTLVCRMYTGWNEAVNGFRKNMLMIFAGSRLLMLLFFVLSIVLMPLAACLLPFLFFVGVLAALLVMRVFVSILSGQPVWMNLLLHPVQMLMLYRIIILSFISQSKGHITWKGRNVNV
jgi:chlorobactene glucosyltransferase